MVGLGDLVPGVRERGREVAVGRRCEAAERAILEALRWLGIGASAMVFEDARGVGWKVARVADALRPS